MNEIMHPVETEQEPMSPEETMRYMIRMGEDISRNARTALTMMEIAKERGQELSAETLAEASKFAAPNGKYEHQLMNIRAALGGVGSAMFKQGIKITREELEERLNTEKPN